MAKRKSAAKAVPVALPPSPPIAVGPPIPTEGTILAASAIQLVWAGNDCTLVFNRSRPATMPDGSHVGIGEVVSIIQLSAATMKDLSILLAGALKQYESEFGKIDTTYTKSLVQKKKPTAH